VKATLPTWPRTSKVSSLARTLHLFRRDLRLADHAGLAEAARHGGIVPALILDPRDDARLARSPRRAAYYAGAVASLERDLRARGAKLVVRRGSLETAILALAREAEAATVTWCAAYDARSATRDLALRAILEAAGLHVAIVHDAPAVAPEVTAALRAHDDRRGYRAFAAYEAVWAQAARTLVTERITFAEHGLANDDSWRAYTEGYCGDEPPDPNFALAAFDRYLAGPVLSYPSAHAIPAGEATARISAALSFGVLSARTLLARIDARARDPFLLTEEKLALAALTRAFVRRDFFLQLAWYFDEVDDVALQVRMRDFPFALDHPAFAAWCDGETGYPLVDAGIRQLHATGWMHPRVRAVVASFCAFDLGIDWRIGRDVWDVHLVEDAGALATGNWQWIAGVGADLAQVPRIYNPRRQLREIDSRGTFVRRWIPELALVNDADLLDASPVLARPQMPLPLHADAAYPAPVVDHDRAARAFLERYAAFVAAAER
jgi:deoxyribodipyrimidine photo-lyase